MQTSGGGTSDLAANYSTSLPSSLPSTHSLTRRDSDRPGEYRSQSVGGAAVIGGAVDVLAVVIAPENNRSYVCTLECVRTRTDADVQQGP